MIGKAMWTEVSEDETIVSVSNIGGVKWLEILLFVAAIFLLTLESLGQKVYPQDYFTSPLDVPLNLAGNFGELRTNHFHAGLDIKTQQQEGLKIYSVAEGYISRIKVSPFGYGYCLYVTHPNGYTSVYGHMLRYSEKIDKYTKNEQYKLQSFSVDLFPSPTDLPVYKGEIIGLSGNSGGSGGPHLHFEIRETDTEKVLNPLLFGFQIKDKIAPSINSVLIVPMNDSAWVNSAQIPVGLETKGNMGNCVLKNTTPAKVYGDIGFAIHASDALDGNANRCGIYRIELFVDGLQVYGQRMDRLDFTTNRAMNAHTIYEKFKKSRSQIHGSYRLPGNPLDIYDNLVNDGILSFRDGKLHQCEYKITDINGNKSTCKFQVQSMSKGGAVPPTKKNIRAHWNWEEDNTIVTDYVKMKVPAFTLYEDLDLTIEGGNQVNGGIGGTWVVASPYEPVHNAYEISLNMEKVPVADREKTLVVRYDPDKGRIMAEGGKIENGWITAAPSYLGYFSLMTDRTAPNITSRDFAANMKGRSSFSFTISDGLSGIDQIIPKIDGQWVLMEFDAKSSRLTYYFDKDRLAKGKHSFELTVIDERKNEKKFTGNFEN
jgi:hypothetical protein